MRALVLAALLAAPPLLAQDRASSVSVALEVGGEVEHPLKLSVDELRALMPLEQAGGYGGVRLADVLAKARIRDDQPRALRRTYVVAVATDGYQAVFSWGELFNSPVGAKVLVAIERDGAPLRDGEGRFALVSLADNRLGPRHVKWLSRVDVRRIPE